MFEPRARGWLGLVFLLWAFGAAGCRAVPPASGAAATPTRDGVLVHVSAGPEQAHRLLMGLRMAALMAEGDTRDVLVYFDLEGVRAVLADATDVSLPPFASSKTVLTQLRQSKAKLVACRGCLTVIGKQPGDLAPGVAVAERDGLFGFTKGRILALDY